MNKEIDPIIDRENIQTKVSAPKEEQDLKTKTHKTFSKRAGAVLLLAALALGGKDKTEAHDPGALIGAGFSIGCIAAETISAWRHDQRDNYRYNKYSDYRLKNPRDYRRRH
jgi:uncharacterized membrane protein YebE (DUF533 family)